MFIVNTDYIEGTKFEMLSIVTGSVVQSKNIGRDIGASFKGLIGGELEGYTEMLEEAREISTERMIKKAESLGADAIVNVRYTTSSIMQGASEVLVYGTAVKYID